MIMTFFGCQSDHYIINNTLFLLQIFWFCLVFFFLCPSIYPVHFALVSQSVVRTYLVVAVFSFGSYTFVRLYLTVFLFDTGAESERWSRRPLMWLIAHAFYVMLHYITSRCLLVCLFVCLFVRLTD